MNHAGDAADLPHKSLAERIVRAPMLAAPETAAARVSELYAESGDSAPISEMSRALLLAVADHSPYLWRLIKTNPDRLRDLFAASPEASLDQCLAAMRARCGSAPDRAEAACAIRLAKQATALIVALADLGGLWDLVEVTRALTRFADAAVSSALIFLLREAGRAGALKLGDVKDVERGCGLVILALGKQGAGELNYSSDIDLAVFFDPRSTALPNGAEPSPLFVRMTQALARLLQERTGEGYGLRVDLRLRPDPGSTAVAIALPAAFAYYEMLGQNWERAALIKARVAAGDAALGDAFLHDLAPFIWRKYFDYAAIADIHAMKRQIHAVRGHAEIAVAGHDVKLGRGGIREIEFFVQTQQLIFGGRRRALRGPRTLDMLAELAADGWVDAQASRELSEAYIFLRTIEHRLQMIDDEQTQRLPSDPETLMRFAKFCGFAGEEEFSAALLRRLERVEWHYARLFEHAPGLDAPLGNLVFTGVSDDPETIETLGRMGFSDPARAAETVRGWHFGRRPSIQSARAREVLTELVPALLDSFAGSGDPDAALAAFDAALARMPGAVELFSILRSNRNVRELFGDILGGAPRLAGAVVLRPHLLDAAIDPALLRAGIGEEAYAARAANVLAAASTTEEFLDGLRDLAQEEIFLVGVRTLSGMLDAHESGRAYSAIAESVLRAALAHVEKAFALDHGRITGGRCVVVGLGKLGSREMTAASDLDLMLLYDFDEDQPQSDGRRPLHAVHFYTRLTQRLVSALTVATRRGRLYDVDMRLRPSGGKGPVATQLRSFLQYQENEAETWERMSLCRARVVAGDESLTRQAHEAMTAILRRRRDSEKVRSDAVAMRRLIAQEKGEDNPWDLKLTAGGLLDLEFIAQYLILRHAADEPLILRVETERVLALAGEAGFLAPGMAETLVAAHRLYTAVMQMMRLTTNGGFDPAQAAAGVLRRIAAAADLPDFGRLESEIAATRQRVRAAFDAILGG